MEASLGALGFATPEYYPPQATVSLAETTFMPSPEPSVKGETEKKPVKKRKSWGQELPTPKTNLPPRKRAKTEDEKEQRRIERVLRNRQAAQSSRERKRQEVEKLEGEKMSVEDQNIKLKERLMTVEHEKFQLAQQVARLSAEMSRYRHTGSLAPTSTATSCAPSPSLHPDMFQNIKQEIDDVYPFSLPTPQHSVHLTPPSTSSFYSRSPSPFNGGLSISTSPSDLTQHPAAMLCGLQCQSEAAWAALIPPTSPDVVQRRRNLHLLYAISTQIYWMTLISAVYSHLLRPLRQIFLSLRTGSPLPIKTTHQPGMISLLILWLISTPANLMTTPPTPSNTTSTNAPHLPTFRIRLLRRLLLCSPALARPLKEAAAGSAMRLKASYALNRMSKDTEKDVLVVDNGDANGSFFIATQSTFQSFRPRPPPAIMGGGSPSPAAPDHVSLLILGAGWTSQFLLPLLSTNGITHAATTRSGHDDTIPFTFDPSSSDLDPYRALPGADTVLITFPLLGPGPSHNLVQNYRNIHGAQNNWIQLGSTGIWPSNPPPLNSPNPPLSHPSNSSNSPTSGFIDNTTPYTPTHPRAIAEDQLRALGGCVLNLSGLYGGQRQPRNWLARVAKCKDDVRGKGALHLVHGGDVARGVVGVCELFAAEEGDGGVGKVEEGNGESKVRGKRYILTDLHVYDWWDLFVMWGRDVGDGEMEYETWVWELMTEEGVRALPREGERLGRRLDGRAFWEALGIWPEVGRVR